MFTAHNRHYRTIFISDFHIGAKTFNAGALLDFLQNTESEKLYLVGDIIDGWKLSKRWYWSETINRIFDELVRKAAEGTQIIYVPGNHDDAVRHIPILLRARFSRKMGIKISNQIIHKTADGRRFIVMHGDQFDTRILSEPVLKSHHMLSNVLGDVIGLFKKEQPMIDVGGVMKKFSLAKYLSKHGRLAIQALNNFEGMVYRLVKSKNLDGIICGHTHIPVYKAIRDITYANTGSWLRNGNTALVEERSGALRLIDWDIDGSAFASEYGSSQMGFERYTPLPHFIRADSLAFRPVTETIVQAIEKIWRKEGGSTQPLTISPAPSPDISFFSLRPACIALSNSVAVIGSASPLPVTELTVQP